MDMFRDEIDDQYTKIKIENDHESSSMEKYYQYTTPICAVNLSPDQNPLQMVLLFNEAILETMSMLERTWKVQHTNVHHFFLS